MLSLFVPSFFDIFLGLLFGLGAVALLLVVSQLIRKSCHHGLISIALSILVGIFVTVQAGLWIKSDGVLASAESSMRMANGMMDLVDKALPADSVSSWTNDAVGSVYNTGKEGLLNIFSIYGEDMMDSIRDFRNHRVLWGVIAFLVGAVLIPIFMEDGGRGRRRRVVGASSSGGARGRRRRL